MEFGAARKVTEQVHNAVALRVLRIACDWSTMVCDHPVENYGALAARPSIELAVRGGTIALERSGRPDPMSTFAIWMGGGLRLKVYDPAHANRATGMYHAQLDVQGALCSTAEDGLDAIEWVRRAVRDLLWPTTTEPVDALIQPAQTHVCVDTEVIAERNVGSEWLEREVFARGSIDDALAPFATRARAKTRGMVGKRVLAGPVSIVPGDRKRKSHDTQHGNKVYGSERSGRTLYVGKDPQFKIYEKDRAFGTNKDLADVQEHWRANGWDGEHRVFRTEVKFSRDWLADNDVMMADGELVRLGGEYGMCWPQYLPWVPAIFRELLRRTRHTDRCATGRVSRRPNSPLWQSLMDACGVWERDLCARYAEGMPIESWRGIGNVIARRRKETLTRATARVERGLVVAHLIHSQDADDRGEVEELQRPSLESVALRIVRDLMDDHGVTDVETAEKLRARVARALNISDRSNEAWRAHATTALEKPIAERREGGGEVEGFAWADLGYDSG